LDITVLAGGPSAEREVSLLSGAGVASALTRLGHAVTVSDIRPDDLSALDRAADFVFVALHGEFGEDGQVQALLEARGLSYCGSDAEVSALVMNKVAAKQRVKTVGIPTPPYRVFAAQDRPPDGEGWELPAVVKPIASGSSVDTFIVRDHAALCSGVQEVAGKYGSALVERYIQGPELTVGILGDQALPVCQIRTRREFYNYQAKYLDDDTEYLFDIDLPAGVLREVQRLSLEAHRALGCRDFSRVDWMVEGRTLQPYLLEVNSIPGFTSHSLLPKAAARVGVSFEQLCQTIVDLGLRRDDS